MVKYFCDACRKDMGSRGGRKFEFGCHIPDILRGNVGGYVDEEMNMVSGRDDSIDLCHDCYNRVAVAGYSKFLEIRDFIDSED